MTDLRNSLLYQRFCIEGETASEGESRIAHNPFSFNTPALRGKRLRRKRIFSMSVRKAFFSPDSRRDSLSASRFTILNLENPYIPTYPGRDSKMCVNLDRIRLALSVRLRNAGKWTTVPGRCPLLHAKEPRKINAQGVQVDSTPGRLSTSPY